MALMKSSELTTAQFQELTQIVYDTIGVNLTEAKRPLVLSRLSKRLRELSMDSFGAYIALLRKDPKELEVLFNRITTNVTKFFREEYHFEYLTQEFLPQWVSQYPKEEFRAWSAGCASGEEPYTIAMVLDQFLGPKKRDFRVLATDINTETIRKAQSGRYSRVEVEGVQKEVLKKYFLLGTGPNEGFFRVKDTLRERVSFKRVNLTDPASYPLRAPVDIVFCRNVFIYFDKQTQAKVIDTYHRFLKPGGLLFLGHSESIGVARTPWRLLRHTIYQRLS